MTNEEIDHMQAVLEKAGCKLDDELDNLRRVARAWHVEAAAVTISFGIGPNGPEWSVAVDCEYPSRSTGSTIGQAAGESMLLATRAGRGVALSQDSQRALAKLLAESDPDEPHPAG